MILSALAALALVSAAEEKALEISVELPVENISEHSSFWFSKIANRDPQCGRSGSRAEKLAKMYDAITDAAATDDGASVIEAAEAFQSYVEGSDLAEGCWNTLRKRASISRKTNQMIEEIADLA